MHASHVCHLWRLANPKLVARSSCEALLECTLLSFSSHSITLPLHDSHLNIEFLNVELQANLARNQSNKIIEQIQPYSPYNQLSNWASLLGLSNWALVCGLEWDQKRTNKTLTPTSLELFCQLLTSPMLPLIIFNTTI